MTLKHTILSMACAVSALSASAQASNEQIVANTEEAGKAKQYSKNVLAFSPIQLSENGVAGVGVSYERSLDKQGYVALYVPFYAVMAGRNTDTYGTTHHNDPMYYLAPGIKIYPTGNQGKVKYAIGPSLTLATGYKTDVANDRYLYLPVTGGVYQYTYDVTRTHTMLGMMVNQSLNINATPHLYLGSEFGFGFTYLNRLGGVTQSTTGLVQFSFKIGYRF